MNFTVENALKYIENEHPNMFIFIKKNKHRQKDPNTFDLCELKKRLLYSSDNFLLSFVKYFDLDIYFFLPYSESYLHELLEFKYNTSYHLLMKNNEYKNINWKYHYHNGKTLFGYLIKNLLCINMVKELINNDSSLLDIKKFSYNKYYKISCLEELLHYCLFSPFNYLFDNNNKNYSNYDWYNDSQDNSHNDSWDDLLYELYNNKTNIKNVDNSNNNIILENNLFNISIYLHNKLLEDNINFTYGFFTTIKNNILYEYSGIIYNSIKYNFFDFVEYLIDNEFITYDFIFYNEENKTNYELIQNPNNNNYTNHSLNNCYYKNKDIVILFIEHSYDCNQHKIINFINKYPKLKNNKSEYLNAAKKNGCDELIEYLENI